MNNMQLFSRLLIGASLFASTSFASLIPASPFEVNIGGTGFGNVSTLITLQTANGQSSTEAGCIGAGGSFTGCGITQDGKIKNSSSLEPVPTGVSAADLRFVFNASQPSGGSITLNQMEVTFYNGSTAAFTANLGTSPVTLNSTLAGTGQSGFVFQLNSTEAAQAQAVLSSTTAIGAGFAASGASGGQDTLFLETASSTGPGPGPGSVPEPASYALVSGGALLAFGLARRRQKQS